MDGLIHLLNMAGQTIAQLQQQNEALRQENSALLARMASEPVPSTQHAVVDPRPAEAPDA